MKSLELLKLGKEKLVTISSGKSDAMELLMLATGKSKIQILNDFEVEKVYEEEYFANLEKRLNGEPMQKFFGFTEFMGVKISFNKKTLTPRQETEILADIVVKDINNLEDCLNVLDLCAGSGCIGLAIKKHTSASVTLADVSDFSISHIKENAKNNNIEVEIYQSNHEGAIIDKIHEAYYNKTNGIIINPGAYTHTSIAIMDAIKSVMIPTLEVHLSDITKREEFRKVSYIGLACEKRIMGKGFLGYQEAIEYFIK